MVLFGFGDFDYICRNVPSYPVCNLWFSQLLRFPKGLTAPATQLLGLPAAGTTEYASALRTIGVGVNPSCYINRMAAAGGAPGSGVGNVANIALCGVAVIVGIALAIAAGRRAAAVGRIEMRIFFLMYALVQGCNLVDTGAFLRTGSAPMVWVSGIHMGLTVGLFWVLLWIAFLSLQVVEDGTLPSIIPMLLIGIVLTVGSSYIFLDTAFGVTNYFQSSPPQSLHSIWIFVLVIIWPSAAAALYFIIQLGVVVRVLKEKKPLALFAISAFFYILSQGALYGISHKICTGTSHKVDGSFLATLLETMSVGTLFAAWRSITEDSWDGVAYMD